VGASRQLRKALRKLGAYLPEYEGVDTARLSREAQALLDQIEAGSTGRYPRFTIMTAG